MSRKKIALLMNLAIENVGKGFLTAFQSHAAANDCDVFVFASKPEFGGFELFPYLNRLGIDGIFVVPSKNLSEAFVRRNTDIPMVCAGPELGTESVPALLQQMGFSDYADPGNVTVARSGKTSPEASDLVFRNFSRFLSGVQNKHSFEELREEAENFAAGIVGEKSFFLYRNGVLPDLGEEPESPITRFFFELDAVGCYSLLNTDPLVCPGEDYRMWLELLSICLQLMKERELGKSVRAKLEETTRALAISGEEDSRSRKIAALSPTEREELHKVERLLDENLFTYHFQPIVSARTGDIFSFEALMRPQPGVGLDGITPLHILKYAELRDRLGDVEKSTFLNITGVIDERADEIGHRLIFINSIPGARLLPDDYVDIESVLWDHSKNVVVEVTEQTEADEQALRAIKRRYEQLGIDLALDDYGTGYSNVTNLLQYMPRYVKIDRSLLAEIEKHPKKQRFVREIIEFCHDNDIQALAEGIETWRELRMVIRLGADLIQGYYTGRPAPELPLAIDNDVRREIQRYREEYQAGRKQQVYMADDTGRVNLNSILKSEYSCILIGREERESKDVTISGTSGLKTNAHVEVYANFQGRITLDNAYLTGTQGNACITLGENCDVKLTLLGDNHLEKGGILVPESSRLTVEGAGNLSIYLDAMESYGIGNDKGSHHGEIVFDQDGTLRIDVNGNQGICIGSGLGGKIVMNSGKYQLSVKCETGVGVGAFHEAVETEIRGCAFELELAVTRGVGVGSLEDNATVSVTQSSVTCDMEGTEVVGFGSIGGEHADIHLYDANISCSLRGESIIGFGSLSGETRYKQERVTLRVNGSGSQALAYGGYSEDVWLEIVDSDTSVEISTAMQRDTMAPEEHIKIKHGRNRFLVNGYDYHHEVDYE